MLHPNDFRVGDTLIVAVPDETGDRVDHFGEIYVREIAKDYVLASSFSFPSVKLYFSVHGDYFDMALPNGMWTKAYPELLKAVNGAKYDQLLVAIRRKIQDPSPRLTLEQLEQVASILNIA